MARYFRFVVGKTRTSEALLSVYKVVLCACRLRGRGTFNGSSVIQPRLAGNKVLDERHLLWTHQSHWCSILKSFHAGARRTRGQLELCSEWVAPSGSPHGGPAGVWGGWDANLLLTFEFQIFLKHFRSFARRTRHHSHSRWGWGAPTASPHTYQRRWGVVWAAQTCSLVPFEFWTH